MKKEKINLAMPPATITRLKVTATRRRVHPGALAAELIEAGLGRGPRLTVDGVLQEIVSRLRVRPSQELAALRQCILDRLKEDGS